MLVGPNTGLGHNSIVFMIESQLAYVMDALRTMDARGAAACDARREAQAAVQRDVQRRMRGTVWTEGGCASWYLDAHGRNTTLWPGSSWTLPPRDAPLRPGRARAAARRARRAATPALAGFVELTLSGPGGWRMARDPGCVEPASPGFA